MLGDEWDKFNHKFLHFVIFFSCVDLDVKDLILRKIIDRDVTLLHTFFGRVSFMILSFDICGSTCR